MKKISKILLNCSIFAMLPVFANAAGTYYNSGLYQSPQTTRYSRQTYSQTQRSGGISAYNQNRYGTSGYTAYANNQNRNTTQNAQQRAPQKKAPNATQTGFSLDAGISHQMGSWQFEMANAGSILRWDDLNWNVFDANGKYVFNAGNTALQIGAGIKYGMQSGDASMIDDDITNNRNFPTELINIDTEEIIGTRYGAILSTGTASDGSMFGYNIEFGLTDFFKWGNARITPIIGWRSLSYETETSKNYGLGMDYVDNANGCITLEDGSVQCDPLLLLYVMNPAGTYDEVILLQRDEYDNIVMPDGSDGNYLEPEGSYYFYQPGVSHSYEVEWAGPYLALDMSYLINQYNQISGRIELGLPSYSVTANQPGRYELQHPKSVEDEGGIGDAFHFGLGANWSTAITDKVALSIGLTYDYYTVSDATAKTYVNSGYYTSAYDQMLADLKGAGYTEEQINSIPQVIDLKDYIDLMSAQGWTYTDEKEIESVFKSMGIRVGINARF
ncbi:MAG: hypothetical protein IKA73_01805 [Alphaproteobacteria bacterium]|nr:hypothetical protein [Alphaproteobacteria bacterium]MBR2482765.1 hypothetical protein [Alphaproteobacteria bacterium]